MVLMEVYFFNDFGSFILFSGRIEEAASKIVSASSANVGITTPIQRSSVSEAMLPRKYFRKPISQTEMQTIEVRIISHFAAALKLSFTAWWSERNGQHYRSHQVISR